MKKIKRIFTILLVLICIFSTTITTSFAATPALKVSGAGTYTVGNTVTITAKYTNVTNIDSIITYDKNYLEYKSASISGVGQYNHNKSASEIVATCVTSTGDVGTITFKVTFKIKKAGETNVIVSTEVAANDGNDTAISDKSAKLTLKNPEASKNATLSSITLTEGSLYPSFDSSVTSYTVDVENKVSEVLITCKASDSKAKTSISGENALAVGQNERVITVTAASGDKVKYVITINRATEDGTLPDGTNYYEVVKEKALTITIEGVNFLIEDEKEKIVVPQGFTLGEGLYNGYTIPVLTFGDLDNELIYLNDKTLSNGDSTLELKSGWYYLDQENNKVLSEYSFSGNELVNYVSTLTTKKEEEKEESKIDVKLIYILGGTIILLFIVIIILQILNLKVKRKNNPKVKKDKKGKHSSNIEEL